ncbi:hypothetical protein [Hymenobacter canadensis]|uniref:Tip attachment protein J domain-containing protein n=1 Tax=Hymenobacter canadensis TaxID=2999067 RepID=A0ABY7LUS0_9BACT|nr:hypothetical protein [Hymenobacter canadensis]WBA43162.1 hypothetical protein O3303_06255 [Hymenobacter canadensis]
MARTLIQTYCVNQPDNSVFKTDVYYTTGRSQQGLNATDTVTVSAFSCNYFVLAEGTILESYCVTVNGVGKRREITMGAGGAFYPVDVDSRECDGTCDLFTPEAFALPTTTTTSADGLIRVEASSSFPPVQCYIATLGAPTETVLVNPNYFAFTYRNVPQGTYSAQLQDAGNCQRNTNTVTVTAGNAPGTGGGGSSAVHWFKYEFVYNGRNPGALQGYAWDKTTKQGYTVAPITLTFPDFYQYTPRYRVGDIVLYGGTNAAGTNGESRWYFQALRDMQVTGSQKQPYPDPNGVQQGYWKQISFGPQDQVGYVKFRVTATSEPYPNPPDNFSPFFSSPAPVAGGYWYYEQGDIMRHDWAGFYKARTRLESRNFPTGVLPAPTIGGNNDYWEKVEGYDYFYYAIDESQVIDQYAIGSITRRVRFHTANPSIAGDTDRIIFDDSVPSVETNVGDLKVVDIIKNDIDEAGAENGSVWVTATSPSLPIRYHLRAGVRAGYVQDNATGIYENLYAGTYEMDIYDAQDRYVQATFTIEDRYRKRWKLLFDDEVGVPLEIFILERDWNGPETSVCGTDAPVMLSWDSGGSPAGYLPEAVGANLDFNVYTDLAQQFLDTIKKDDRNHRVDYYRDGRLQFRGYIDATSYTEKLLGAGQKVTITATDGLGQLKNTKFVNHLRERQVGRTSMLSIVLKCLSYCDVNLPVFCGVNLRDRLMAADADPLAEAYVHRNAYNKKDEKVIADEDIIDVRTVLDNLLRLFNAMMFQADGYWKIISLNEVYEGFETRVWSPAGQRLLNVDTGSVPLRILESKFATGERELYWINSSQTHTVVAAAQIGKAVVDLQLEENLFRNGDFVEWDGSNVRPLYWTMNGALATARAKGEKAKEYAVQFSGYSSAISPDNYLLSPPVPHLTGQDEDGMIIRFKAIVDPVTNNPEPVLVSLYFQVLCDGSPYGQPIEVELSSQDKWKEYSLPLLTGLPGTSVRVRLLAPVAVQGTGSVRVNSIAIAIQPGLVDWSEQKQDYFEVTNPVQTGIRLEDLQLVHADLPRLPGAAGQALPPKRMDVYAWRHAVSLVDFRATTGWKRPAYPAYTPLLDNAVQDRMALRAFPNSEVTGEVRGPGIDFLRIGLMLDMPEDIDGRFLVISCFKKERKGTAQITVRRLASGNYGDVEPELPDRVRSASKGTDQGYRISFKNGIEGYRIARQS